MFFVLFFRQSPQSLPTGVRASRVLESLLLPGRPCKSCGPWPRSMLWTGTLTQFHHSQSAAVRSPFHNEMLGGSDKEASVIRATAQSSSCSEASGASVCQGRRPGACRLLDQLSQARQEQTTQMHCLDNDNEKRMGIN